MEHEGFIRLLVYHASFGSVLPPVEPGHRGYPVAVQTFGADIRHIFMVPDGPFLQVEVQVSLVLRFLLGIEAVQRTKVTVRGSGCPVPVGILPYHADPDGSIRCIYPSVDAEGFLHRPFPVFTHPDIGAANAASSLYKSE